MFKIIHYFKHFSTDDFQYASGILQVDVWAVYSHWRGK